MKQSELIEQLQPKLEEAVKAAIAENITGVAAELNSSEDGNLTVSVSLKLNLNGNRVAGAGSLSYSRKFKDDFEFITDDPNQLKLPSGDDGGGRV
jgi:hypothetical protein